jgi:hypothetical protein
LKNEEDDQVTEVEMNLADGGEEGEKIDECEPPKGRSN